MSNLFALLLRWFVRPVTLPAPRPIAGTTRGFEVRGHRRTPPIPASPTITEILEGRRWKAA